jgi:hypothetical protein
LVCLTHFVVPGSRVKMAVGNRHVFADIGADPVRDISLIHRVNVNLVLSWAWEVDVAVLDYGF